MISWHQQFARPFESPWSIAQKLAWLNVSEVPDILSTLAGRRVHASTPTQPRAFTDMGWWGSVVSPLSENTETEAPCASTNVLLRSDDDQRFRQIAKRALTTRLRVCPACIRQGYHSIVHQLAGLTRCPIHGMLLRDTCSHCHRPYGACAVYRHQGFRCPWCNSALLPNDSLPAPAIRGSQVEARVFGPLVGWIERTLPTLELPWVRNVRLGRWEREGLQITDLSAALLPLLATIEPCPLEPAYLVAPLPQLVVRHSRPCPEPVDASAGLVALKSTVKATETYLSDSVLKEHADCYRHCGFFLWYTQDSFDFRPEFCHRAYAFALWRSRTYAWLRWIRDAVRYPESRLAINPDELRERLLSSYHEALNGIELLCSMYSQGRGEDFKAVLEDGCLDSQMDLWMRTEETENIIRLVPCRVTFEARPDNPGAFCDHHHMFNTALDEQKEIFERIRARAARANP